MASESPREAAAFWAQLFRDAVSATAAPAAASAGEEGSQVFNPIFVGFIRQPSSDESVPRPPPDRIMLVDPVTRGVVVLRGDPAVLEEMMSAGAGRKGPPPASRVSIEALQIVETVDAGEECAVCLEELQIAIEDMSARDLVKEMPCNHRFHCGCIEKWLGLHGTCPVCRYCMPAEEVGAKKAGGDGNSDVEVVRREVWFEVTFEEGGSRDLGQEQEA